MDPQATTDELPPHIFVCESGGCWHIVELNYTNRSATRCKREVAGLVVALSYFERKPSIRVARAVAARNGYIVESAVPDCPACFGHDARR